MPVKGLKPYEVAEHEAWDGAGIKGKAKKKPFGYYTYLKVLDSQHKVPWMVEVYLLKVDKVCDKFPELGQQAVQWVSPVEAASLVPEPELKGLLAQLR